MATVGRPLINYSRNFLLDLRNWENTASKCEPCASWSPFSYETWNKLKILGLWKKRRGCRAGIRPRSIANRGLSESEFFNSNEILTPNAIQVLIRPRQPRWNVNDFFSRRRCLVPVNKTSGLIRSRITPKCLIVNVRSLVKPGALQSLQAELFSNNIDLCFLSETWLHDKVDKNLVTPVGFSLLTKNRNGRIGGGVGIACRDDWKMKEVTFGNNAYESVWAEISPTEGQMFYVAAIYHPPDPVYNSEDFIEFLEDACESILTRNPNAKLMLAGDVNNLNLQSLKRQFCLSQLVNSATRGTNILDIFLTNTPLEFDKVQCVKSLVRTDHKSVIINPRIKCPSIRKWHCFRDTRGHCKLAMLNFLKQVNWDQLLHTNDLVLAVENFYDEIKPAYDNFFPEKRVRMSSNDPVFISPLVKHLLEKRKRFIQKGMVHEADSIQPRIDELIRINQMDAVRSNNQKYGKSAKKWWDTVNSITGRKSSNIPLDSLFSLEEVNEFFQKISTDKDYIAPNLVNIPEYVEIPKIHPDTTFKYLSSMKKTSCGPDGISYWFFKEYALELAPVITHIFNLSIKSQTVPTIWKMANITPLPKESPLTSMNQLRPISITDIIIRLFERIIYHREVKPILKLIIGQDQFAYKEKCNTTLALIKCQHTWLKWLDNEADYVRVFAFDFSKAFDSVNHSLLFDKFKKLPINPYVINWVIDFLKGRMQRVLFGGISSSFLSINRGVPQGTILGPVLFSIMVNDIMPINHPNYSILVKYADDLTLSTLVNQDHDHSSQEVNNILDWAKNNNMQINLSKTKEITVKGKIDRPPPAGIYGIEQVQCLKLLGLYFHCNPSNWDLQFENLLSKVGKRMYILRICKSYGYSLDHLHHLFHSLIMSVFRYGISVWGLASNKYMSLIDRFQKRAVRFGYLKHVIPAQKLLHESDLQLWKITISSDSPLSDLLPPQKTRVLRDRGHKYILPKIRTERFKRSFINRCLFNI